MIRIVLHFAREAARHGALVFASAWCAAVLVGATVAWLDGDAPEPGGVPEFVLGIAALSFVPALGLAMPLSIVALALRIRDDGESLAAAIGGVAPLALVLALALPWLPLLALVGRHAHVIRPAAAAALVDAGIARLRGDPGGVAPALLRQGVAADQRGGRTRILMPWGQGCVAVELEHLTLAPDAVIDCGPGRFALVDRDGASGSGTFRAVELASPAWTRPLAGRSEQELTTGFLERSFGRYQRARASDRPMTELWRRERRERDAVSPCMFASMLLALVAVGWTRRAAILAHLVIALPAIAIALLGPRAIGAC